MWPCTANTTHFLCAREISTKTIDGEINYAESSYHDIISRVKYHIIIKRCEFSNQNKKKLWNKVKYIKGIGGKVVRNAKSRKTSIL